MDLEKGEASFENEGQVSREKISLAIAEAGFKTASYFQGHFFLDKDEPFQVYLIYIVILSRVAEGLARRSHSNRSREGGMQVLTPAR